ncbi:DUF1223 domain-containing protein [Flavobacteriaceae bacterium S356]|uniref:DUF1223 domain-containing protein n=1 Tax=Asprobacillus argus TaxID=3076534 RepID=A0ABU3LF55_9FLAO|nr:DUF1223 domain-containing protein [Flavobacteriaceae bacterium S356]
MRYFFFLLLGTSLIISSEETRIKPDTSFVVMQLFTSQGCSSCPAADVLAEEIKKEYNDKNVMILSYHVTYWDRLGWKDPFGKKEYTEMQYAYATKFKERRVYTPQIVVNGKEHFIGSDEYILRKKVKQYLRKRTTNTVQLNSTKKGNQLEVTFKVNGEIKDKKVVLALVLDKETTQVRHGENAHKNLSNSNIVIVQKEHSLQKSQGNMKIDIPKKYSNMRLITFVQDEQLNITGGNQIKI